MQDPVLVEHLIWRFLITMVFGLGIVPVAGGAIIWKVFQIAKVPNFTFMQCWKAYLAACAYAYVLAMIINAIHGTPQGLEVFQLILFCVMPFLVVPLFLRNFAPPILAIEAAALVVVDVAVVLFVLLSNLH